MENMDKGLSVPKLVLIYLPKILKMPQNVSAQIVCQSPKVWDFDEKRFHWASIVRDLQFIAVTIESAFYYYFLGRKQNFYDKHSGVSNLSILDSIAFCRKKKLQIFRKALVLEGT